MARAIADTFPLAANDPDVLQGQMVFAGTRVPLGTLVAYRRKGRSLEEYLLDFPTM